MFGHSERRTFSASTSTVATGVSWQRERAEGDRAAHARELRGRGRFLRRATPPVELGRGAARARAQLLALHDARRRPPTRCAGLGALARRRPLVQDRSCLAEG